MTRNTTNQSLEILAELLAAGATLTTLERVHITARLFKIGRVRVKDQELWNVRAIVSVYLTTMLGTTWESEGCL